MKTIYHFEGSDLFLTQGSRVHHVYPASKGFYWFFLKPPKGMSKCGRLSWTTSAT